MSRYFRGSFPWMRLLMKTWRCIYCRRRILFRPPEHCKRYTRAKQRCRLVPVRTSRSARCIRARRHQLVQKIAQNFSRRTGEGTNNCRNREIFHTTSEVHNIPYAAVSLRARSNSTSVTAEIRSCKPQLRQWQKITEKCKKIAMRTVRHSPFMLFDRDRWQ